MAMMKASSRKKSTFLISDDCHPQTIAVCLTRAEGLGINIQVTHHTEFDLSDDVFGVLIQYPATNGQIDDLSKLTSAVHEIKAGVVVAADILSLAVLTPPGEWGADVVVGSTQRFGIPMGFGGPHAAFFATTENNKRKLPGRVIGVSKDVRGLPALRMAMQSREQHIRRDKASSNICTAQALLANCAAAYAVYHGPEGIRRIATRVHALATAFAAGISHVGLQVKTDAFFDTVQVDLDGKGNASEYLAAAEAKKINLRYMDSNSLCIAFDETNDANHVSELLAVFAKVKGFEGELPSVSALLETASEINGISNFARTSPYLTHPVFNTYHSETDMMRYLYKLQMKDLSLCTAMIPLGSCTMKLNAASEMIPVTWATVNALHPFAPRYQVDGYYTMLEQLSTWLAEVTGFHAVSLQPNSGAQGEFTGLLAIRSYHEKRNEGHRNICLIPTSAHGTNPASAVISGLKVVVVGCDEKGNIDMADLEAKTIKHRDNLNSLMVTYPSTHGVFESTIKEAIALVHDNGGLVYMDGANLNAQLGLCSPGGMGADVCHLNLHKTFCIPHGGGGPGMGPIGVVERLAPFLPTHPLVDCGLSDDAMGAVAAAPFSSASILPISWMYMRMMGPDGLTQATNMAILNANYMATRLRDHYDILYTGENGTCAHEFILDIRPIKARCGVTEEDIAKRLMDFNFHAPTMSFPVAGTLMVEPTESEPLVELDRMCDALIAIRAEIAQVESGEYDVKNNPLRNSPHTMDMVINSQWDKPYSVEVAAFPAAYLKANKFWPTVGRIDGVYGDRNVVCTCPPIEDYL
jgi:glycine dehydrogenase